MDFETARVLRVQALAQIGALEQAKQELIDTPNKNTEIIQLRDYIAKRYWPESPVGKEESVKLDRLIEQKQFGLLLLVA